MESHAQILKFGGTSVGNGERIRRVANIIVQTFNDPAEAFPVVVVSAMAEVTDQLLRIAVHACAGEQEAFEPELETLKQRHRHVAEKAIHNRIERNALQWDLEAAFSSLEQDVARLRLNEGVGYVAAWGERLSVLLVAAAVADIGLQAVPVREEIIITDVINNGELSQPLGVAISADPLFEETRINAQKLLSPLIEQRIVPIVAGFIGRTLTGDVTTLGRNGSDYSASVIGAALDCVEISIYTDVDGVLTADPRLVMNVRLLPALSYAEAACLSWFGAKVLHPRTLIPIAHRDIPVHVRNTFHPDIRGTMVGPEGSQRSGAAAITIRRHLALITVESTDLFGAPENAGQVFALVALAGANPIAICSSSGHHLSFVIEEHAAESVVTLLQQEMDACGSPLQPTWRVHSRTGLAACACFGSGFTVDPMTPAYAIITLTRERILVITQGTSELGITLIVEDTDRGCLTLPAS